MEVGKSAREGSGVAAVAKVLARGQFTIPEAIRKVTGVSPGDSLLVRATGPDRFEVMVLPHITADEFFAAMALRDDLTEEDLRRAVEGGIEQRVLPEDGATLAEVAAASKGATRR